MILLSLSQLQIPGGLGGIHREKNAGNSEQSWLIGLKPSGIMENDSEVNKILMEG